MLHRLRERYGARARGAARMSGPHDGRTALVTGGGNGLGAAIAAHLVDAGARVVLVGRRPEPLRGPSPATSPTPTRSPHWPTGWPGSRCRSWSTTPGSPGRWPR